MHYTAGNIIIFPWYKLSSLTYYFRLVFSYPLLTIVYNYRLAKSIGEQFRDRLRQSHDQFTQAIKQLDLHHTGRLEKAEERRQKLRKVHAPRIAKLAMESSSLRDLIMYGEWSAILFYYECNAKGIAHT